MLFTRMQPRHLRTTSNFRRSLCFSYWTIISTVFDTAATSSRGGKHRSTHIRIIHRQYRVACIGALWYVFLHCFGSALPKFGSESLIQVRVSAECYQRASVPLRYGSASCAGLVGIVCAYDVLGSDPRGEESDEQKRKARLKEWDYETSISEMS